MRDAQAHSSALTSKRGYFCSYARSTSAYVSTDVLRRLFLLVCEMHKHIRQHGLLKEVISTHMRDSKVHTSALASKDGYFTSYARCTSTYISMGVLRRLFLLICEKHKYIRQHGLLKEVISTHMGVAQAHTLARTSKGGYFYSYARCTSTYVNMGFLKWLFLPVCEKHNRIRQHELLKEVISTHMREAQVHTSAWAFKDGYFYSYARNTSAYVSMGFLRWLFLLICEKHKYIRQHGLLKEVISTHMRDAQVHTSTWPSKHGYFYSYARNISAYVSMGF